MRVGLGYDAHRLVDGRELVLGGVIIPHDRGLLGHSDADVLTHAVVDAILGALGLGDIGSHFPDSDSQYFNISSLTLLEKVATLMQNAQYQISNIDAVIIAELPKLSPYIAEMSGNISKTLGISNSQTNVKATTEESMGFTGRKEGIAAHAIVLIQKVGAI